jgi:hypothetical protein
VRPVAQAQWQRQQRTQLSGGLLKFGFVAHEVIGNAAPSRESALAFSWPLVFPDTGGRLSQPCRSVQGVNNLHWPIPSDVTFSGYVLIIDPSLIGPAYTMQPKSRLEPRRASNGWHSRDRAGIRQIPCRVWRKCSQGLQKFSLTSRQGLDPGTLGVLPQCPGTSLSVQIRWPDEVECPPTSTEVLSRLNSWLDSWLDQGSFQVQVTIQFRGADGEEFELRLGEEMKND